MDCEKRRQKNIGPIHMATEMLKGWETEGFKN